MQTIVIRALCLLLAAPIATAQQQQQEQLQLQTLSSIDFDQQSAQPVSNRTDRKSSDHTIPHEARLPPPYYTKDDDPQEDDQPDIDFSLMNAQSDKLQAVNNLLSAASDASTAQPMQCSHKGKQYANGQVVPIEEQPCLSCTCKRAILQCYLRVCPPIVSLEAHKRRLHDGSSTGSDHCQLVKEPSQCCATLRCTPPTSPSSQNSQHSNDTISTSSSDTNIVSLVDNELSSSNHNEQTIALRNRSIGQEATTTQASESLPKLTVINGLSGQHDSILLITSNPHNGTSLGQQQQQQGGRIATVSNASSNDGSAALLDAFLDQVLYSSAAQLNGLNLQGSCMVNGSLYMEGSAVIPETSTANCQYCYCIRQKVMCVRPKCHLSISGCTPKYGNELACCPTSYTCSSTLSTHTTNSQSPLSAKLSAAIESFARLRRGPSNDGSLSDATPRQLGSSMDSNPLIILMNSMGSLGSSRLTAESVPTEPNTTTTSTSTTTTTTSTSTTAKPTTTTTRSTTTTTTSTASPTTLKPEVEEDDEKESDEEPEAKPRKRTETTEKPNSTSGSSTTTSERPATSISDFLEPMNKLGPMVTSTPSGCTENNRQYAIGEQIPTLESCKHCYCGLDGLKECRMIECDLKVAHNCRPVTPEGHCCPIRYECPPMSAGNNSTSAKQRHRSNDGDNPNAFEFKNVRQCGVGLADDCDHTQSNSSPASPTTTASNNTADNSLDNIPGLSVGTGNDELVKTARLFDMVEGMGRDAALSENATPFSKDPLADDLNKFIMRINANQSSDELSTPVPIVSTLRTQDYNSVQPPLNLNNQRVPPSIPEGVVGIPSIKPETINNLLQNQRMTLDGIGELQEPGNRTGSSSVEYSTNGGSTGSLSGAVDLVDAYPRFSTTPTLITGEPRDARSTNAHRFNNDDSYDTFDGAIRGVVNMTEMPHGRVIRNQHSLNEPFTPAVIFDDEINGNPNRPTSITRLEPINATMLADLADELASTPTPPQPTTGTPIGLDADRTPETNGWLKSLSGLVSSFGRRLSGTNEGLQGAAASQSGSPDASNQFATGRSQDSLDKSFLDQLLRRMIGAEKDQLVMRPLDSVMQQQQLEARAKSAKAMPAPYAEPTLSSSSEKVEIVTAAAPVDPEIFGGQPVKKDQVEAESRQLIVGASTSFARRSDIGVDDLVEGLDGNRVVSGTVADEPIASSNKANSEQMVRLVAANPVTEKPSLMIPSKIALTCNDVVTNRTYQPNEIIAREDPCDTCTCVLGKELCQKIVCPERPPELDCREERRPGQCCPTYLCGGASINSAPNGSGSSLSPTARMVSDSILHRSPIQRAMHVDSDGMRINSIPSFMQSRPPMMMNQQPQQLQQQQQNRQAMNQPNRLPQHPIRTNDLNNFLPTHLRFRPNMQSGQTFPYSMVDQNKFRFPIAPNSSNNNNNIRPQFPSSNMQSPQIWPSNEQRFIQPQNNNARGQHFPSNLDSLYQRNPLIMNPSVAMNSQRVNSMEASSTQFVQPQPNRRTNPMEDSAVRLALAGNSNPIWKQPTNNIQPQNNMPTNVLTPRMSVAPQPINVQHISSDVGNMSGGWQPSSGLVPSVPFKTNDEAQKPVKDQMIVPNLVPKLKENDTDKFPSSPSSVTFETHNSNLPDSGFRPIVPNLKANQMTSTNPTTTTTSTTMTPTTMMDSNEETGLKFESNRQSMFGSSVNPPVQPIRFSQELPSKVEEPAAEQPIILQTTTMTTLTTEPSVSGMKDDSWLLQNHRQSATEVDIHATTSTTKEPATSTTQDDSWLLDRRKTNIDIHTTSAASDKDASKSQIDADQSSKTSTEVKPSTEESIDPLASLFRVSECNIYGRLYKVGQPIDELSGNCKRCKCTSTGVDCQDKC